ncbi:DUF5082 domain-containing protein [Heyndrickxia acidiproducens]|jgi:hypothetical protein|uniref:DUF5082 domain-containing protein n=1 Tax=Heyndrickxia acidiproducens TaxID=1121084 RepID=UPI00036F7E21|nr:DUF5082 domain-containing protein [Heyndrickxia acidiproducens]
MDKAELIRKKANMQAWAAETRQNAVLLEEKIERLQRAKRRMEAVIEGAWQQERKAAHIDFHPPFWKGETKNKYMAHFHEMESSVRQYVHRLRNTEDRLEEEIRRLSNQLDEAQSNLLYLQSHISNLSQEITEGD